MQKTETKLCQLPQLQRSDDTSNNEGSEIFSEEGFTRCESIFTFDKKKKDFDSHTLRTPILLSSGTSSQQSSFYSQSTQIRMEDSIDNQLIFGRKIQKKDIAFKTMHFKQSFVRYFVDVIYGFLKQPTDLTFSIALERLKYYDQQNPFIIDRISQTASDGSDCSSTSSISQRCKQSFLSNKNVRSVCDMKSQNAEEINVEGLLRGMFLRNEHQFMIYTFDFALCHLTFLASMLYFWSNLNSQSSSESSFFLRTFFYNEQRNSQLQNIKNSQASLYKINIFKTLKLYIMQRSQSLNISQVNILIVRFFLNHLKSQFMLDDAIREVEEVQQIFISKVKLYRRIKRMEMEFNCRENQVVLQWQLHKYQYQNKLIQSMEKTFLILHFLNTHNFVSSPLEKYYQLHEFENSKKQYHLKKDYFCIWVMTILLRLCEKKSSQSLSKSAYYIITFLGILKKFKQKNNFEGISLIVPILYNIKQHLPKVWRYAESRRKQINQKLREYSQILTLKLYKTQDIINPIAVIINDDLTYEICGKFTRFAVTDKRGLQVLIDLDKHRLFYQQFLSHITQHRRGMQAEYKEEVEAGKGEKEIGVSFNMYLLDNYVGRCYKGVNAKQLWGRLIQRCRKANEEISVSVYSELFDYCFIGSTLKYNQIDI